MSLFSLKNIGRNCFLLLLTITLIVTWGGDVKGQQVYAQYVGPALLNADGFGGEGGVKGALGSAGTKGTFSVTSPAFASDADLTNSAALAAASGTSGTGVGGGKGAASYAFINLFFTGANTPIAQTPIIIKLTGANLTKIKVQGYNSTGVAVGLASLFSTLPITSSGDYVFTPTLACSSIRITVDTDDTGLLGITSTNSANLYYAYMLNPTCSPANYTTVATPGVSLGGGILRPKEAIDGDLSTYSTFDFAVSLLTSFKQTAYFSSLSNPGDAATVTFSISPAALVNLDLLSDLRLTFYNGTTKIEPTVGLSSLLRLDLLSLIKAGKPYTVSVVPSAIFDRIEVSTSAVLSLLTAFNIHEIQRTPHKPEFPSPASQNVTICAGNKATLTATLPSTGNELRWYETVFGGTALTPATENTYVTPSLSQTTTYYVATAKSGCTAESERVPVIVTVLPKPHSVPISPQVPN